MAILSALFSFLGKKAGDILSAVLGWSVTALFGRLSKGRQTAFAGMLLASLVWPAITIGIFVPSVTAWSLAAAPVDRWVGPRAIRMISIGLAIGLPPIVGLVTRVFVPSTAHRPSVLRAMLFGYPLTVGYACSCVVSVVTVTAVKLGTVFRRWDDEHIYVQPMRDKYRDALRELALAAVESGTNPTVEDVPALMSLPTRIARLFARGVLDPLVVADPQRLRTPDLEVFLYPADLLVRGSSKAIAKFRTRMHRTLLERSAFLVAESKSQHIQSEIGRMWEVLDRHGSPDAIGGFARGRLQEIVNELSDAEIPYDEWVMLDRMFRRLELVFGGGLRIPTTSEHSVITTRARPESAIAQSE